MRKGYRWAFKDEIRLKYGCSNNQAMICTTEKFYKLFRDAVAKGEVDIELKNRIYETLRVVAESMLYERNPVKLKQLVGLMRKILYKIDRNLLTSMEKAVIINSRETTMRNAITDRELIEFREMYFLSVEACRLIEEGIASSKLLCNGRKFIVEITDQEQAKELARNTKGYTYAGIQAWNWHYDREQVAG